MEKNIFLPGHQELEQHKKAGLKEGQTLFRLQLKNSIEHVLLAFHTV